MLVSCWAENILLTSDKKPKIADYGLAKPLASGMQCATQSVIQIGTPGFADPYQPTEGDIEQRHKQAFDVYSFGVTLLVVLAGSRYVTFWQSTA